MNGVPGDQHRLKEVFITPNDVLEARLQQKPLQRRERDGIVAAGKRAWRPRKRALPKSGRSATVDEQLLATRLHGAERRISCCSRGAPFAVTPGPVLSRSAQAAKPSNVINDTPVLTVLLSIERLTPCRRWTLPARPFSLEGSSRAPLPSRRKTSHLG